MKRQLFLIGLLAVLLGIALTASLTRAQEPPPPTPGGEVAAEVEDISLMAVVGNVIPIQGRLTDRSGNPVADGDYDITASIYNVSSGGTALCSDTDTVAVSNGLFTMNVDFCTSDDINGQQLYLGIKVGSDAEMTPRRAIYPVPYAFSLRPGAVISDTSASAVLNSYNHGNGWGVDAYSKGHDAVHGRSDASNHAGVSGENTGGGIGVYGSSSTGVAIKAAGTGIIQSTAATDWVVSPLKMVQEESVNGNDLNIIPSTQNGYVKLYTDGQDDCQSLLPVDVAAYLFGTRVNVSSFTFCYNMDNTSDKITQVDVEYVGTDGAAHNLCSYTTDVSSTTWACRTCTPTSPAAIYGPVFVRFSLHFAGDGSSRGIRLGHMYLHLTE